MCSEKLEGSGYEIGQRGGLGLARARWQSPYAPSYDTSADGDRQTSQVLELKRTQMTSRNIFPWFTHAQPCSFHVSECEPFSARSASSFPGPFLGGRGRKRPWERGCNVWNPAELMRESEAHGQRKKGSRAHGTRASKPASKGGFTDD